MAGYTMLEQKIADDLVNHGFGTQGVDIFIGQLPAEVESGLFIVPTAGQTPELYIDTEYPVFDFWYRSDYTDKAHKVLRDIYNLYNRRANYALGDWYVYFSHATGTIMDMDRDRESGKLFKLSVLFECRNTNNVS